MLSVGTDIVNVSRIRSLIDKYNNKFLNKVFSDDEIAYCNKYSDSAIHYAGKFSAKEAVIKAISKNKTAEFVSYKDIVISNDEINKPFVISRKVDTSNIELSISHTKEFAFSFAVFFNK